MFGRRALIGFALAGLAVHGACRGAGEAVAPPADADPSADADHRDGAAAPRTVLFVGNSYTYVNDLPREVAAMAAVDAPLATTAVAIGGATLADHWNGAARPAIELGGHDVVVLQGQSLEPILAPTTFAAAAAALAGAATAAGAQVVFYGTWARRAGDPFFDDPRSGGTPAAMQELLTTGYAAATARAQARLAPVGDGFRLLLTEAAAIDLYDPDGSHPSPAGTYLAAATLVEAITGQPPTDAARLGLDAATRAALRDAAHRALVAPGP